MNAFTLLEVMVATAIVSAIALGLFSAMRTAQQADRSGMALIERARTVQAAAEIVRHDFAGAMPPTGLLAAGFIGADGDSGEAAFDTVNFTTSSGISQISYEGLDYSLRGMISAATTVDNLPVGGDLQQIEVTLVDNGEAEGATLVRRAWRNLLADIQPSPIETVLLRGVTEMQLRYFDGSQWQPAWDSGTQDNALPNAVELSLKTSSSAAPLRLIFTLPAAGAAQEGTVLR